MSTSLPVVTVAPYESGWLGTCGRCGWRIWQQRRPVVDLEAEKHRGQHARRLKED